MASDKPTAEERLVKWCANHYVGPIDQEELVKIFKIFSDAEAAAREPLCKMLEVREKRIDELEREVERLKAHDGPREQLEEALKLEAARAEGYRAGLEEADQDKPDEEEEAKEAAYYTEYFKDMK